MGRFFILVALVTILAAGCGPATGSEVNDYASLTAKLRAEGATVQEGGEVEQEFFSVKGRIMVVNGEDVQVFEYQNEATARAQVELVSSDGTTIGTTIVLWVAPPHFYQRGRLVVLYVGENPEVLAALQAALGAQFAGS